MTAFPIAIGRHQATSVLAFVALALTWGTSFLFIKIALDGFSPVQIVIIRMVLGSLTLGAVLMVSRQRLPREPIVYAHLGFVGVFLCVLPFLLFSWAELQLSSGVTSILNATTPLMTMIVALIGLRTERLGFSRVLGLAISFAGVVIVFAPWNSVASFGQGDLLAKLACLAATLCYGIAFVWLRRFIAPRGLPAIPVAFLQVGQGTVLLLIVAPWLAGTPVSPTAPMIGALVALGVLGTGLAYVWNTHLVASWGAVRAATVTYLIPPVGVIAGAIVLKETITPASIVGAAVIIFGIVLGHSTLPPRFHRPPQRNGSTVPASVGSQSD